MRAILCLIYGVPALLLALLVAAFINSTQLSSVKKNELTYGSIGEASKINPILAADEGSMDVVAMIFEGLLTSDTKFNIKPWLAKSYSQEQVSTFLFQTPEGAQSAEQALNAASASWPEWSLKSVRREDKALLLDFDLPGYRASDEIAKLFDPATIDPATVFRADLSVDARETLKKLREAHPEISILREWFDYSSAFEITTTGDANAVEAAVREFLKTADPKATLSRPVARNYLAEPIIRFKLRDDVRWQDGQPFTSEDCVFTYDSLVSEEIASPRKPDFDLIRKVEAPTPYDFIVTYRKPYSSALLSWSMPLIPAHILKGKSKQWWGDNFNRRPIGTGPFKFDSWKTNEYVKVSKNTDYWGEGPWLDSVVLRTIPDPTSLRLAFETHQIDLFVLRLSPWAIESFEKDPKFEITTASALSYGYVGWNMRRPFFEDPKVREALTLATNIPDILKFVYYGNGVQSNGIYVPELWFSDSTLKPLPYDPEKAKQLLDEAGWKVGKDGIREKNGQRFTFKLITNQGNDVRKDIATLMQDNLKKIGIEVKVEIYEWAVFIERFINKNEFDACVLGWSVSSDWDVYQIWHSSQTGNDQLNHVGYKSKEADSLIEELRQEYDRARIKELASKLQRRIYEDQPMIFISNAMDPIVTWKNSFRIRRETEKGWVDTPFETAPGSWYYYINNVYRPDYAGQLPKADNIIVQ